MTNRFITISADGMNDQSGAIYGVGTSPDAAFADAVKSAGYRSIETYIADQSGSDDDSVITDFFTAIPATEELYNYVAKFGTTGDYKIASGTADFDLLGLPAEIVKAARIFAIEFSGEHETPTVIYVKHTVDGDWSVRFSAEQDSEMHMTRWNTGKEVSELYKRIRAGDMDAANEEAGDIEAGWDSEWDAEE